MRRPTYRTIPDYPAYSIDTHGHVWKDTEHGLTKISLEIRSINVAKAVLDMPHVALEAQGQPTIRHCTPYGQVGSLVKLLFLVS